MSASVREITESEFQAVVLDADKPVVVDFWAPWCGPCRGVAPALETLAERIADSALVVKVNVDEARGVAMRYGVMSIPTIAKFERGTLVAQVVGVRSADALARELGLV